MKKFFAICPFCHKSIYVEENLSGGYACSSCGQALGFGYLVDNNLIIDAAAEAEEYALGQEYFKNTDFREAKRHFDAALKFDRNNYLAEYYGRICDIYENESNESFELSAGVVEALKVSIEKMELSQAPINNRIEFLSTVLGQCYILFSNYFSRINETYGKTKRYNALRNQCMQLAIAIKEIILIDKEKLMVFDDAISKSVVSITDLGICACQKIVEPHLEGNFLDTPTEFEYNKAKTLYGNFYYYATSLDSKYDFINYKPDYTGNLLYNETVITKLDVYNALNRSNQKKYLSTRCAELDIMVADCRTAIKYSYYTCFKSLYNPKNDQSRAAIVTESIAFCFETLKPRVCLVEDKKIDILCNAFEDSSDIAFYLNAFLNDLSESNRRLAADYVNRFYEELYETVKLYYSVVYGSYNRFVNKLKELKNKEFKYYINFLYQVTSCCSLALKELVSYDQHKLNTRLKLLKMGKETAEEFLLLFDYRIEEIERNSRYADILDVFNYFDSSVEALGKK